MAAPFPSFFDTSGGRHFSRCWPARPPCAGWNTAWTARQRWPCTLHRVRVEQFIASHRKPPRKLILDFDATDDPVHSNCQVPCQYIPRSRERLFLARDVREVIDVFLRCPPWRAKRRRVVPGSREATRDARRAEGAKEDPKGASECGVQLYGRPVCSRNELAMLWRNAG